MWCHIVATVPFRHTTVSRCGLEDFETGSDHLSVFKLSLIQIRFCCLVCYALLFGPIWVKLG